MTCKTVLPAAATVFMLALTGMANPIEDATYAFFFNRAAALLPGLTHIEHDLRDKGEWQIVGGQRIDAPDRITVEAQDNTVEFIWKGGFPESDRLAIQLELAIIADTSVQATFFVFSDDQFRQMDKQNDITPGEDETIKVGIYRPPHRRYGDRDTQLFEGLKVKVQGDDLAGQNITLKNICLKAEFSEGFFRRTVEIPAGEIWEAVAEVGAQVTLYVNGERVDDETVIMPRPSYAAQNMYTSRRVPLQPHLKPGRNVLGMHVVRMGGIPAAYLRGSVVMSSGERILLDSDTNWIWNRTAPANWRETDYNDAGWQKIMDIADIPREMGGGAWYRGTEAVADIASNYGLSYRPRGDMPCYDGFIKLRNPADKKFYFQDNVPFQLEVLLPPGFKDKNPELIWEISRYESDNTARKKHPWGHTIADITDTSFVKVAEGRVTDFEYLEPKPRSQSSDAKSLAGKIVLANDEEGFDRDQRSRLQKNGLKTAGALERGIYVFTSRLMLAGEIIEEREPEAMVVVGRVDMPKTAGDFWEQDMDITLERVIDFTDPEDPHPWFETDNQGPTGGWGAQWGTKAYHTVEPALIVERNGLKYRETRPVNRAQISYFVDEFKHPGDWYLMVLEYPDDAERWIGVSCNAGIRQTLRRGQKPEQSAGWSSKCGPAIWTGGKYPNTGKMLEMKWIYRPDPGSHAFNVMSLMRNTEAAAARLRIYHIRGRLPELNTDGINWNEQRRFGMLTERTFPWGDGIYNLFSSLESGALISGRSNIGAGRFSRNVMIDICEHLRLTKDAASHYAEYMRFTGHNLHTMGCFQYSDGNTASQCFTGDPRLHDSSENMLARVFQANNLMFYASVEFTCTERQGALEPNPEWYFTDRTGQRPIHLWANKLLNLNFMHPEVETEMLELARQLAIKFQHQPNFLGINWTTFFSGFWIPSYRTYTYPLNSDVDPLNNGYDDLTVGLFEQDTGIKVGNLKLETGNLKLEGSGAEGRAKSPTEPSETGINNQEPRTKNQELPSKYERRYQFLTSPEMKPVWLAWRAQKMAEFFAKMNRTINEVRPGLETVAGCYFNGTHVTEWKNQGGSFTEYMDQWGWNPAAFADKDGVWLMPWLHAAANHAPAARSTAYAMYWQGNHDPDFYRAFSSLNRRAMMLHVGWIEVERIASHYPYREGWPRPYQQTMMGQQREEMAMEPYTQAMIGFDPQMLMMGFTDVSPYIGVEGMQRKFTRVLRRLPWGEFKPVPGTGFDSNFAIRTMHRDDGYWFYVANPGYWPISGTVTLKNADKVTNIVTEEAVPMQNGTIKVELEPFGIAAFRAQSGISNLKSQISNIAITTWSTDPIPESELAHMRDILQQAQAAVDRPDNVAGFLGYGDYAALTNGVVIAKRGLAEGDYATAWAALTDATFWTVVFEKMPLMSENILGMLELAVVIPGGAAPVIDGDLNDRIWKQRSATVGPFISEKKQYSSARTLLHAARPGRQLCFAFECHDPAPENIRATATEDDGQAFWRAADDMVIITIMDDKRGCQFAVNANGVKSTRYIGDAADDEFMPDWQVAVKQYEWGWIAEILITPHETFSRKTKMTLNAEWGINFHRLFRGNEHPPSSWTYTPDWQSTEKMGILRFERYQR